MEKHTEDFKVIENTLFLKLGDTHTAIHSMPPVFLQDHDISWK
jgi:hypothetical protein